MKINAASLYGAATWTAVNVTPTLKLSTSANDVTVGSYILSHDDVTVLVLFIRY